MSLSPKIAAAVDALARDPATADSMKAGTSTLVSATEDRFHVTLALTSVGQAGVAFETLELTTRDPSTSTTLDGDALKAWGERLVRRLSYLMEPLSILEIDTVGGEADLRSARPTTRDGHRYYYEMRLAGDGSLRLRRKAYDESQRRGSAVPCQMTREMLDRFVDDLVEAAPCS